MAIHSRKPFTADEPTEFNFDNGNALLVSPAGGNVHGAFLEAVQVTRLEDKDEVSFKSAHIVLSPVQIIAFFASVVRMTGYSEPQLRELAFERGLIEDPDAVKERLRAAPRRKAVKLGRPKDNFCKFTDQYGDVLLAKPVADVPGLVEFTFSVDGEDATLVIPPDMVVILFTTCCRVVNYTPEEMRKLATRERYVKVDARSVPVGRKEKRRNAQQVKKVSRPATASPSLASLVAGRTAELGITSGKPSTPVRSTFSK